MAVSQDGAWSRQEASPARSWRKKGSREERGEGRGVRKAERKDEGEGSPHFCDHRAGASGLPVQNTSPHFP